MNRYNLGLLSDDDRACIEFFKQATFDNYNQKRLTLEQQAIIAVKRLDRGEINRAGVKKLIDASNDSEKLRSLINEYRGVR
jgi:hypothetical protein